MPEAVGRAFQIGMIYTLALLLSVFTAGAENLPEPKCVDLGLSVEWADANLGASSPSESGGYYAFGEIFTKESYHWDTYPPVQESLEKNFFKKTFENIWRLKLNMIIY